MALERLGDAYENGGGGYGQNNGSYPPRRPYQNGNGGNGNGANHSPQPLVGRVPPQNLEAEMAVLGAMVLGDRGAIEKATEILTRDDFYRDAHAHLYDAMVTLTEKDEPVDAVTLRNELTRQGILEQIGGVAYIVQLADVEFTTANIAYYARIVAEKAILRRLIDAASQIAGLAYGEVEEVGTLVDKAERTIFEVARRRDNQSFAPLRPLLNEAFDKISDTYHEKGMVSGVDTGFDQLNYITSGLQDGDLIIVAARPSMGKCLTAGSLIDNPLTGERVTLETYVKEQLPLVSGLSDCGCVRPATISHWIDSGVKPVWRVTTRTGRSVEVTGHHPFLTVHGWTPLHDLHVGDKIGVPRQVPVFGRDDTMPLGMVRLMAYFIAEGGLTGTCPAFTNTDPEIIADFHAMIATHFPGLVMRQERITYKPVRANRTDWRWTPNPVTAWLRELGLMGKGADFKRFPACVWQWDKPRLAEFLRVLMSCDGSIYSMGGYGRIEFAVASEGLARDVQHALTRFGIVAKFWRKKERCWRVEVTEPQSVEIYQQKIGWIGEKTKRAYLSSEASAPRRSNNGHAPRDVWPLVREASARHGLSLFELARQAGEKIPASGGYNSHTNRGLSHRRLAAYAEILDDHNLRRASGPDVYWDEITGIESIGEQQVYDLTVPDGANFIANDVCVHNTSLCLGIGQNAALRTGKSVAVFSLEMSKEQLVQRMICSEARIDAHRLRTGYLDDSDWGKISEAVNRLWDANLFIDDSNDLSSLEMRAKCRRLRAEHGLDLVIVDYLQLMRGHGKSDANRNEEITQIARGLKGLARELKVPVIALSQLSRAVERREDKRPMLSDLRECVTGDTRLYCADTGRLVPIADIKPGDRILAVDKMHKTVAATVSQWWHKGTRPVFRVTTETGRVLETTANHPFLTDTGYKPLCEIAEGDLIATAQALPSLPGSAAKSERAELCRFLGYMVGDGSYGKYRAISFISADREVYDDARAIITQHFPQLWHTESETKQGKTCWEVDFVFHHKERHGKPGGNPLINWLHEIGLLGQLCHNKRVPTFVFEAGETGAREYLAGYLATDGCVKKSPSGKWDAHFDTVSHDLARDVQHLLLRVGVVSTIQNAQRKDGIYRAIYRTSVNPQDANLRQFARMVCPAGRKGELLQEFLQTMPRMQTNPGVYSLPPHVSLLAFELTKHLRQQGRKLPEGEGRQYWKNQNKRMRRDMCEKWAGILQNEELGHWAQSDVLWEKIRSVEPAGEKDVYDICVPETGCFLAEGVVVHNSGAIEAEADVVGFIYRPAYYERKEAISENADEELQSGKRAGEYDNEEAEIIIAKQRNGPTGTVKLAFMPKFARFDNLEMGREENPF